MKEKLTKKYGLFTAICLVVGTVIGSGIFFKAQVILQKTNGNVSLGILAWIIGGAIMLTSILTFSCMAQKYEKVNGVVDYAEATVGKTYAYFIGWFLATTYYPTLTSVLAWLSARYTLVFITSVVPDFPLLIPAAEGGCIVGPKCMALMMFYLCCSYGLNALSPRLAGRLQTTTTVIKLIPLGLMAVVGVIVGLANGTLASNFTAAPLNTGASNGGLSGNPLFAAVCATAFAYEGWIIATSINAELKDSKKNLPRALIIGGIIIIGVYIAYYLGVSGGAPVADLVDKNKGAMVAFTNVFGNVLGNILNLFIAISCMGAMNGLMLGCTRGMYAMASRGEGFAPKIFTQVDKETNMPNNSSVAGLFFSAIWGLYFYLSNLAETWKGAFVFDPSEIPIISLYALYIPIFIMWMVKNKDESALRRCILPSLAICSALFMIFASIIGHGMANVWYFIVFTVIMAIGAIPVIRGKIKGAAKK